MDFDRQNILPLAVEEDALTRIYGGQVANLSAGTGLAAGFAMSSTTVLNETW